MQDVRTEIVKPNDWFWKFLSAHRKKPEELLRNEVANLDLIGIDPGETTGLTCWDGEQFELCQLETKNIGQAFDNLNEYFGKCAKNSGIIDHIRVEEYRIYNWMADQHSWSLLHTPQLIGAIKVLCHIREQEISFKLAHHPKKVFTDEVLKRCGLYAPGLKHGRDALRHTCYLMAFPEYTSTGED